MKTRAALLAEAQTLIPTRDLRTYGIQGWTRDEQTQMYLEATSKPVEVIDTLAAIYLQASENMDANALQALIRSLKRCGPRRSNGIQ